MRAAKTGENMTSLLSFAITVFCIGTRIVTVQAQDVQSSADAANPQEKAVDIRLPPNVIAQPQDRIFRIDESVTLTCEAEGSPQPEFEWLKNGKKYEYRQGVELAGGNTGTFTFPDIYILDEGNYQCKASNMYGKAVSRVASLRRAVNGVPSDTKAEELMVGVGQELTLNCDYGNSYPQPEVNWVIAASVDALEENAVALGSRVQIDLLGNLHFMNVETGDGQNGYVYKCITKNSVLDIEAGGSYKTISVQPGSPADRRPSNLYKNGDSVIALLGEDFTLNCVFSGYPTPTLQWKRTGGKQLPAGRHTFRNSMTTLIISRVEYEDAGEYVCTGMNNVDSTEEAIDFKVESVPVFTRTDASDAKTELRPLNLNITEGDDAVFHCQADAKPAADVQWYSNGDLIASPPTQPRWSLSADGFTFTVQQTCKDCPGVPSTGDLMVVQCNASNAHGYVASQGYLNVLEATVLTLIPKDYTMTSWDETILFECDGTTDDSTPLTFKWWHKDAIVDDTRPQYELSGHNLIVHPVPVEGEGAKIDVEGDYTCKADNGYHSAEHTATLNIPSVPPPPPVVAASFPWQYLLIFIPILLLILIIALIYYFCIYMKETDYLVDEKDRKNGYDPERELRETGFHDFQRREDTPFKGSRASLTSTVRMDTDDEASLLEYGEPDSMKFNEDGSFIGQYYDKSKRYDGSTV